MTLSEFKGSWDSVATELDPLASKFDAEELAFLGPHILDMTKERR